MFSFHVLRPSMISFKGALYVQNQNWCYSYENPYLLSYVHIGVRHFRKKIEIGQSAVVKMNAILDCLSLTGASVS